MRGLILIAALAAACGPAAPSEPAVDWSTVGTLRAIHNDGEEIWAVGDRGIVLHHDGNFWGQWRLTGDFFGVFSHQGVVVAIGCDGNLTKTWGRYGGAGPEGEPAWVEGYPERLPPCLRDITSTQSEVIAVGDGGKIFVARQPFTVWLADASSSTANLRGVSAYDATSTRLAVGDGGTILRKTPGAAAWTRMDSPSAANLTAVHLISAGEAYAAGEGGTILGYDGTRWSSMPSGTTAALYTVHGGTWRESLAHGEARTVFAAGAGGVILRLSGRSWLTVPSPTTQDLFRIAHGFAVGAGATLLEVAFHE